MLYDLPAARGAAERAGSRLAWFDERTLDYLPSLVLFVFRLAIARNNGRNGGGRRERRVVR